VENHSYLAISTLIFAAISGIGSVVRVYQNLLMYRLHKRMHEDKDDDAAR